MTMFTPPDINIKIYSDPKEGPEDNWPFITNETIIAELIQGFHELHPDKGITTNFLWTTITGHLDITFIELCQALVNGNFVYIDGMWFPKDYDR